MSLDYGQRSLRRPSRGLWFVGALVAISVIGLVGTGSAAYHRRLAIEQGWENKAPPCPRISAAVYRTRYAALERPTAYEGATVTRLFGHVMCSDIDTQGRWGFASHPVCQFTSPNAIRVRTANLEAYFEPGPGNLATVSIEPRGVSCTLGGAFTLFHDPTNW